jgi:hypothetical protein
VSSVPIQYTIPSVLCGATNVFSIGVDGGSQRFIRRTLCTKSMRTTKILFACVWVRKRTRKLCAFIVSSGAASFHDAPTISISEWVAVFLCAGAWRCVDPVNGVVSAITFAVGSSSEPLAETWARGVSRSGRAMGWRERTGLAPREPVERGRFLIGDLLNFRHLVI